MGAKTGLLVFADRDIQSALRAASMPDIEATAALVQRVHPGYTVDYHSLGDLGDDVYPPDDMTYAAAFDGVDIVCDRRFTEVLLSDLPPHLAQLCATRQTTILHTMHSMSDYVGFAVWDHGTLVRALALSPAKGIVENIGEPLDFERPYWSGQHPVPTDEPDEEPYPFPFHPLDLGEAALRAFFGFILEGRRQPDDLDPFRVPLHGFRVVDATGREQAEREAMLALVRQMRRQRLTVNPDGRLVERDEPAVEAKPQQSRMLRLTVPGSPKVFNPSPDFVAHRVREAMVRGTYAILEAEPERYVQAGSGPSVGMQGRPGYAVEYRDGSADAHFRFETSDVDVVVAVFEAYARNDASYKTAYPWQPYPL